MIIKQKFRNIAEVTIDTNDYKVEFTETTIPVTAKELADNPNLLKEKLLKFTEEEPIALFIYGLVTFDKGSTGTFKIKVYKIFGEWKEPLTILNFTPYGYVAAFVKAPFTRESLQKYKAQFGSFDIFSAPVRVDKNQKYRIIIKFQDGVAILEEAARISLPPREIPITTKSAPLSAAFKRGSRTKIRRFKWGGRM